MDKYKVYQEKMEAQLKIMTARIDELKARAQKTKAEVKIEYIQGLEALESKRKDVKTQLEKLKKSGKEAGNDLKDGIEMSLFDLKRALESAFSRFNQD